MSKTEVAANIFNSAFYYLRQEIHLFWGRSWIQLFGVKTQKNQKHGDFLRTMKTCKSEKRWLNDNCCEFRNRAETPRQTKKLTKKILKKILNGKNVLGQEVWWELVQNVFALIENLQKVPESFSVDTHFSELPNLQKIKTSINPT